MSRRPAFQAYALAAAALEDAKAAVAAAQDALDHEAAKLGNPRELDLPVSLSIPSGCVVTITTWVEEHCDDTLTYVIARPG